MTDRFEASWVAETLGLPAPAAPRIFSAIVSDSRQVVPRSLFVALAGERVDGHDYVRVALEKGASGVLHGRDRAVSAGVALTFPVEDTLAAYRQLAARHRARFAGPVVCVAGSVGKTSTK